MPSKPILPALKTYNYDWKEAMIRTTNTVFVKSIKTTGYIQIKI